MQKTASPACCLRLDCSEKDAKIFYGTLMVFKIQRLKRISSHLRATSWRRFPEKNMKHTTLILMILAFSIEAMAIEVPDTCPEKPIDEDSAIALASTWFEKGQKLVVAKEYSDAVDAFACSLRMVEHQHTRFNAGKAAILAEKFDVALEMAATILESATDDQAKTEAEALMAAAERARQEKEQEKAREKEREKELAEITPSPNGERASIDDTAIERDFAEVSSRSAFWKTGVSLSVVGGAGVIIGAVLQGLAGSAQQTTGKTKDYAKYVDAKRNIDKYQTGAIVSFVSGGVFLGAGILFFLLDGKRNEEPGVSFVPSGNGVLLRGKF